MKALYIKAFLSFLIAISFLLADAQAQFKVVGYVPSWRGSIDDIQFDKLTHINYAFILPTKKGDLHKLKDPTKLKSLVTEAHANGVKVLIAVGGWNDGDDSAFESLASDPDSRTKFVNNLVQFVNEYDLDGVDMDWEYPDPGVSASNFESLMLELSKAMHSEEKLLTAAVVAKGTTGGGVSSSVFEYVDFLNIMAYDGNDFDHSTYSYAMESLNYWKNRGLPGNKAILGVPFYGRPSWDSYAKLLERGAKTSDDIFEKDGYNGINTIKAKTNLGFDGGGGIMIWELTQDAAGKNSLLSAIHEIVVERGNSGSNQGNIAPTGQTIWLKGSNNLFVSSENGLSAVYCNRSSAQDWEHFTIEDAGRGKIALRGSNGAYVSSENGFSAMNCDDAAIGIWEAFDWIDLGEGKVALRGNNGLYVSTENGQNPMICNRSAIGDWETFTWGVVEKKEGEHTTTGETTEYIELQESNQEEIGIYPNASSKVFKIQVPTSGNIEVIDMNGKSVVNKKIKGSITVKNPPPGIYEVIYQYNEITVSRKIIVD